MGYFDIFFAFLFSCKIPVCKLDCVIDTHPQKKLQHIFHRKCSGSVEM
jgi:hypothetical protein